MAQWDGSGLPPAAAARMQRFAADRIRTSLLDVRGAVGTESVGLPPVGEVMGCIVEHIGWRGWGGCGVGGWGGSVFGASTVTSGQRQAFGGYAPYVDALYRGYDTAIGRMLLEAQAMGASGVVGVRLAVSHLGEGNREFQALGTAVRAAEGPTVPRPFVTDLAGADVAKLLHAGWVPVSIAVGIAVAVRHDDYRTQRQAASWSNTEVTGYTELVQYVRADARHRFWQHAAASGADSAIVSSMTLSIEEREVSDGHTDHVAESVVLGSTIAKYHAGHTARTRSISVLPLRRPEGTRS